jgi:hypothetical protein
MIPVPAAAAANTRSAAWPEPAQSEVLLLQLALDTLGNCLRAVVTASSPFGSAAVLTRVVRISVSPSERSRRSTACRG